MKRLFYSILILFLVSCGDTKTAGISSDSAKEVSRAEKIQSILWNAGKGRYKDGELLVKFKSGVAAVSSTGVHRILGSTSLKKFSIVPNLEHVKLSEGLSVKDAIVKYMNDPSVEYAEPNYFRRIVRTPNDPLFGQQWSLLNTGQSVLGTTGIAGADIKATAAWDVTTGSNSVVIADLDTGADSTHEDLSANIVQGVNFTITPHTTDTSDALGHGTHVAGIIGAVGNNGKGIAGLMWSVQIMPLKICGSDGSCPEDAELAGIQYAITHGAKIINASFASSSQSQFELESISQANTAGVLFMAAAGNGSGDFCDSGTGNNNDGTTQCYPASYNLPNIISVAATDQNDKRAKFSNYGANSVHVAAPGSNILSTVPLSLTRLFCDGSAFPGYEFCSGTSMSTPHVSGLAGLLYSVYPDFSYSQIRGMIIKYVDVLSSFSQTPTFSNGRINAYKAVTALLPPSNLMASSSSSTQTSLTWTDNATGEDGYKIERKTGDGSFVQVAAAAVDTTSFSDSGLAEGTQYTYRIKAYTSSLPNPGGSPLGEVDSSYSNKAVVTTPANGACGSSNGGTFTSAPATDLCNAGTPSTVSGSGPWTWSCNGLNGGTNASCSANISQPAPQPASSGGGGCSIGAVPNAPTAMADSAVLLLPVAVVILLRRRR